MGGSMRVARPRGDGDVRPVSYALKKWSPMVEKKVAGLVQAAIS